MPLFEPVTSQVLSVSRPGGSLTNSTASDQDYSSVYTIPAGLLVTNRVIRVSLTFQSVTGVSSVTMTPYLKLGSTKVFVCGSPVNAADSVTRSTVAVYQIVGTAAAGASVSVEAGCVTPPFTGLGTTAMNNVSQPVASIATNGTLAITPGLTFSGTGSTETYTLLSAIVELLN